jgi:putative ABC transport system substrate-binding protein
MKRRQFITLIGGAAAVWPLTVRAQQPAIPVLGFLHSGLAEPNAIFVTAFRRGLNETGFVEGRNLAIEFRWAEQHYDRLPGMVTDLIGRKVAVIVAAGGDPAAVAAKAGTSTIPIVFETGTDAVKLRLVATLNRPGGNATGVSFLSTSLEPKRLQLLIEMVPSASTIAFLVNPNNPTAPGRIVEMQSNAAAANRQLVVLKAGGEHDIDATFSTLSQQGVDAVLVAGDALFTSRRGQLVGLAARYAVPASYNLREYVVDGGLMSYGTDLKEVYYQTGLYAGRILKGEKPADLPVIQPTKVEFVINQKTAKALGLSIPLPLLGRADDVIE